MIPAAHRSGTCVHSLRELRMSRRDVNRALACRGRRDDHGAANNDPLVILVEVQCSNRLPNQHDQDGPEHRVTALPLPPTTWRPNDSRSDHRARTGGIGRRCGAIEAGAQERRQSASRPDTTKTPTVIRPTLARRSAGVHVAADREQCRPMTVRVR